MQQLATKNARACSEGGVGGVTIHMERFPFKTVPWVPWIVCDRCPRQVSFPERELDAALDGQVLWVTGGPGAPIGTRSPVFFACGAACAAAIRDHAGGVQMESVPFAEFLALIMIAPEHKARVAAAAKRIASRGQLEETMPHVKARRKKS